MTTNKVKAYCPVTLEPDLEEEARLMTAAQRRTMAAKLRRWARQLEVSAFILDRIYGPAPKPVLKAVARRQLFLN